MSVKYKLLLYEAKRKVFWTRVRISPSPPKCIEVYLGGDENGFDRAKSNRVDSRVGDDPKSSKSYNCK